jgi:N-acetylmuramoyl-L-alanine amidase
MTHHDLRNPATRTRRHRWVWLGALLLTGLVRTFPAGAQASEDFSVRTSSGPLSPEISLHSHRGFLSFQADELARLGWEVDQAGPGEVKATWRDGALQVVIQEGNPFVRWGAEGVHLAEPPYGISGSLFLPLQFLVDILPWKLPDSFRYHVGSHTLELLDSLNADEGDGAGDGDLLPPAPRDSIRVVVIDAGHGGRDTGARGPGGTREKDIALGVSEALARILSSEPNLEVYLTRSSDTLIPIWKRGELATAWRGDRPGIFLSIHANAMPNSSSTQGFETYFLSDARTEHERRVAALENAAQELEREEDGPGTDPELSFILTELRNLDHQHWSASLAELIQGQLAQIHSGPDRGVKQGPLAVLTNALMPAALVEVGFISNPQEERLLNQRSFQENIARSLARAVREFFRRYPPGMTPNDDPGPAGGGEHRQGMSP